MQPRSHCTSESYRTRAGIPHHTCVCGSAPGVNLSLRVTNPAVWESPSASTVRPLPQVDQTRPPLSPRCCHLHPHTHSDQPIRYQPDTRDTSQYRPDNGREDTPGHLRSSAGARQKPAVASRKPLSTTPNAHRRATFPSRSIRRSKSAVKERVKPVRAGVWRGGGPRGGRAVV